MEVLSNTTPCSLAVPAGQPWADAGTHATIAASAPAPQGSGVPTRTGLRGATGLTVRPERPQLGRSDAGEPAP